MKLLFTIGLLSIGSSLFSQNVNDLKKSDSQRVFSDTLLIFYGETLYFEANMDSNKILNFKQVTQIGDSKKTIQVTLGEGSFGGKGSTEMKIINPFNKTLAYKAEMKTTRNRMNFVETSVVTIYPKIFSMELWPEKIEVIMLTNFKLN